MKVFIGFIILLPAFLFIDTDSFTTKPLKQFFGWNACPPIVTILEVLLSIAVVVCYEFYQSTLTINLFYVFLVIVIIEYYLLVDKMFFINRHKGMVKELSKREIFRRYAKNLSTKPHAGHETLTWKTYDGKYLNMINPRRGILLVGVAGSDKSYTVIEEVLEQKIQQGQAVFNDDVKFPGLMSIPTFANSISREFVFRLRQFLSFFNKI